MLRTIYGLFSAAENKNNTVIERESDRKRLLETENCKKNGDMIERESGRKSDRKRG